MLKILKFCCSKNQIFKSIWLSIEVCSEFYQGSQGQVSIARLDGSFHQHSTEGVRGALLAGSYGAVFTADMLGFVDLAHNTTLKILKLDHNPIGWKGLA